MLKLSPLRNPTKVTSYSLAKLIARLDGALIATINGMPATMVFCINSKLVLPDTIKPRLFAGSLFSLYSEPITLSTALCLPISSLASIISPSEEKFQRHAILLFYQN